MNRSPLTLLLLLAACQTAQHPKPPPAARAEARPVPAAAEADPARAKKLADLAAAERALAADPTDEDNLVWLGRRLAYLERFDEAQEAYTRGLALHPGSWKLLRHRGHRWITLREFDRAVEDLARAWELCQGQPDEIEPDGQPNAAGVPIGSYASNIVYHLALAHYLRGEFRAACGVWESGRELNRRNDDRLCSATYWNVLALRRSGRDEEAEALLSGIGESLRVLENQSYLELCLLFRGERAPEAFLAGIQPGTTEFATRGYGLACWRKLRGEDDEARALLQRIVESGPRNAFGCIAAEVELAGR